MEHSHTGDSLALARTTHLPVLPRSPRIVAPAAFTGPGKTFHEMYCALGDKAEKHANRFAHRLGLGPTALTERIRISFRDGSQRESALSELREGIPRKLEKDCRRLVKYALPSESSSTQLEAFKSLVALTTRYPGLRRIFLDCESLQNAGNHESDIALLWDRREDVCGDQWDFHRNFAAACVADLDISSMVEDCPIQSLGSVCEELSIVERLLVASDCEGKSDFSRFIAIRYLGGILDLPSFWLHTGTMFRAVVQKLLVRTTLLLKDLGLDSGRPDEPGVPSDIEGVDILCEVLLARIQTWLPERPSSSITLEAWYPTLYHVVQLLRKSKTEDLLPRSWAIATTAKLRELIPSHYETRVVDALSETGDPVSDQVASLYQYHEQRDPPQTATREEHVLYGTVACTLLEDVSNASNQPYLRAIASLSLSIMETVRANYPWSSSPFQFKIMLISDRMTTNQQACVEMTERACELVCAIINVCRDSEAEFAPTMARSIAQFSQMLKRVLKFVRGHVKAAFWLRLLYSEQHAELIAKYNAGLKDALNVFGFAETLGRFRTLARGPMNGGLWPKVLRSERDAVFITESTAGMKDALDLLRVQSVIAPIQIVLQTIIIMSQFPGGVGMLLLFSMAKFIFSRVGVMGNEEACLKMTERAYELLGAIINICRDACRDPQEELAAAMLRSLVQFSETLEKTVTVMRGQVKGAFWRRVLRDQDLLTKCNADLKGEMEVFHAESSIIAATENADVV